MGKYICDKCNRQFKVSQNLTYHIENKVCQKKAAKITCTKCNNTFSSKKSLQYHISKHVCETGVDYVCEQCNKKFSSYSSLWNHRNKICKRDADSITFKRMQNEIDEMRLLIENTIIKGTINNNIINNINNNTVNINVLVKFGEEDISKIPPRILCQALNKGFYSINSLVEGVHFNAKMPQNHNVCFNNLKDQYGLIYDGTKWVTKNKEEIIDQLFDDKRFIIESIDTTLEPYSKIQTAKLTAVTRLLEMDVENDYIKQTKEEMRLLIYDNRMLPQAAIKKLAIKQKK